MSVEGHLVELVRRHEAIEREIKSQRTRPSVNNSKLAELKKRKLHLKDEMARFQHHRNDSYME